MNLFRIENNGIKIDISPIGASIVNFFVKDKNRVERNIVLGYDNEDQYRDNGTYFGAVVGPIANRVENGEFSLNGESYKLTKNDGENSLHGGDAELNSKKWEVLDCTDTSIILRVATKKGEGGYPCIVITTVQYHLDAEGSLKINYVATPHTSSPLNITQHVYFNLDGSGDVLDHDMWIDADTFLPVDEKLIPCGTQDVRNIAFDFTTPRKISEAMAMRPKHRQIEIANDGFDHCYVLNHRDIEKETMRVHSEKTGITLSVKTDLPGVQFYSGNFLDGEGGRNGDVYHKHAGFCLETQFFPNQVNTAQKKQCTFTLTEPLVTTTIYSVSVA